MLNISINITDTLTLHISKDAPFHEDSESGFKMFISLLVIEIKAEKYSKIFKNFQKSLIS